MKNGIIISVVLFATVCMSAMGLATNGDNLIGIGPISRAMGGVGIAAPQDAISAVFSNPAAQCFSPFCPSTEVNFAATGFIPDVQATVSNATGTLPTYCTTHSLFASSKGSNSFPFSGVGTIRS